MTLRRGARAIVTVFAATATGCSRGPRAKGADSATAVDASDSAGGATAATSAPSPAPTVVDSGSRAAAPASPSPASPAPEPARAPARTPARADSARATPTPSPRATPSEDVLTGKVVAGGLATAPVTSLQIEGRRPMTLVGALEPELRRLGSATVWVAGAPTGGTPNEAFAVTRYEIVAIDGVKPAVGTLLARSDGTWLAGTDTIKLAAVPAELLSKTGAKVWIVGRRSGPELIVQSFGIIREP